MYTMWPKKSEPWKVPAADNSIIVGGVLTRALLNSVCNLKAAHRLIQNLMFYLFGQNTTEATEKVVQKVKK